MAKKLQAKSGKQRQPASLSMLALRLLTDMAKDPRRIEYNTRVLGGAFEDAEVALLDDAYAELLARGLVEPVGSVVSFFGAPTSLVRVTEAGLKQVREKAA